MIGPAEFCSVNKDWAERKKQKCGPPVSQFHSSRPPPEKPARRQCQQRRITPARSIGCAVIVRSKVRATRNQVVERRGGVWRGALREILEVVMPHDRSRMLRADSHPRHSRVTIRIGEINISRHEDVLIIRATRRDDKRAQNYYFEQQRDSSEHATIRNPHSEICNAKVVTISLSCRAKSRHLLLSLERVGIGTIRRRVRCLDFAHL